MLTVLVDHRRATARSVTGRKPRASALTDPQQLYAFVIDKLTERPEVADVRTSVIYEHLRNHAVVPAAGP